MGDIADFYKENLEKMENAISLLEKYAAAGGLTPGQHAVKKTLREKAARFKVMLEAYETRSIEKNEPDIYRWKEFCGAAGSR